VGFKAVQVPEGTQEVTFFFAAGERDLHCLALICTSAVLAFALVGLLLAAPWVLKIEVEEGGVASESGSIDISAVDLKMVTGWSAFAWVIMLAGALFMLDYVCVALPVVVLAAFAAFYVSNRAAPLKE